MIKLEFKTRGKIIARYGVFLMGYTCMVFGCTTKLG